MFCLYYIRWIITDQKNWYLCNKGPEYDFDFLRAFEILSKATEH